MELTWSFDQPRKIYFNYKITNIKRHAVSLETVEVNLDKTVC